MIVTDYNEQFLDKRGTDHLIEELKAYADSIANGNVDLSDYVTKSELQAKLDALHINIDLSSYATKEELTQAINSIDLSSYALKTEIPSLNGYATTEYVDNAVANVPSGGNVDLSNYYTKDETYSKTEVDTAIGNIEIGETNLSNYVKKDYFDSLYYDTMKIYGTKLDIAMPQLPTFDGGTVFHITPPDGFDRFIGEENDNLYAIVKRSKDVPLLYEDIIRNVNSDGYATPTITIPNTTSGYLDDYWIDGVDYIPECGDIELLKSEYVYVDNYNSEGSETYRKLYFEKTFPTGTSANMRYFKFDTSNRIGEVTIKFEPTTYTKDEPFNNNIYTATPSKIYCYDTDNTYTSEIDSDTITIYIDENTKSIQLVVYYGSTRMTEFPYTVTYSEAISSTEPCTYSIWTSNIDNTEQSIIYEITLDNINVLNSSTYLRYSNENLYTFKMSVDASNYYTKEETDALIPTVTNGTDGIDGVDGVSPTVSIAETDNGHTVSITDVNGTQSFNVTNGSNGIDGNDGISPTITVTKEGKVATITCTDVNGTTTATISDGADGSGGGSSSGGASGITYAYDTEIETGETYFDGRPIYMRIFHIDALSSAPSDYIVYGNYHSQTPFADTLVSAEPIWQSNSNQKRFNGNVIQSFTSASGSSGSAAITAVNRLLKTVAWVQAWQSSSEFAITVTRGQDMYEYGCDVFVKYVKSA